jgi:glycosyltransferase involved in cell wall biosynthesis
VSGTPVIGYGVGGIPEAIEYGRNGYICEEISVDCLKDTIISFIATRMKFDRIKIAESARLKYSLSKLDEYYSSLYKSLLNKSQFV